MGRMIDADWLMKSFGDEADRVYTTKEIKFMIDIAPEVTKSPEVQEIKINLHGGLMPEQLGEWIDLRSAYTEIMDKDEYRRISLGVSMQLPEGYYAEVAPRSSTCERYGIMMANSIGIIENDYNGDNDIWCFPAYAIRDTIIPEGARIAQFRLVKKAAVAVFTPVDSLGNSDRGGFGSTGV